MSLDEHEHGPITEYHGTVDLPKVISEGIRGGSPKTRSKRWVPEGLREEDLISYTHPDRDMALAFAQDRAQRMKLDPNKVGVVGVRGGNLPKPVELQEPQGGVFGGTNSLVRPGGISPEYLIQASEDKMKPKKKGIVMIISVGPKMPRKPTDESTPDKEVKKAIPEEWDEQADIQSYRWIPDKHLENAAASIPIPTLEDTEKDPSLRRLGTSRQYEEQIQGMHDADPMGGIVPLPGFKEMDFGGRQIAGTWVMPPDLASFRNPDFAFDPNFEPHSLIGIADSPNFYRTGRETGNMKNTNEGFQYGGFDPEDLYRIPLSTDMGAHGVARLATDLGRYLHPKYERDVKTHELLERLGVSIPKKRSPTKSHRRTSFIDPINDSVFPPGDPSYHHNIGYDKWREGKRRPVTTEELMNMVRDGSVKLSGEPMDIGFQFLKAYEDEHLQSYLDGDIDELGMFGNSFDQNRYPFLHYNVNAIINDNETNDGAVNELMASEEGVEAFAPRLRDYENELKALHDHTVLSNSPRGSPPQLSNAINGLVRGYREQTGWHDMTHEDVMRINMSMYMATLKALRLKNEQSAFDSSMRDLKGEPMNIAFQLLKGRNLSPAARKHKLEYDTKYQSSPKRIKYRVDLNRERRRRGIYGSGNGKDVSHTQGGKLTLENEHDNRARHFKGKGTLRRVKVKK